MLKHMIKYLDFLLLCAGVFTSADENILKTAFSNKFHKTLFLTHTSLERPILECGAACWELYRECQMAVCI